MAHFDVHASTDVTGFGLIGHDSGMAKGHYVGIEIHSKQVTVLPGVKEIAEKGTVLGGSRNNYQHTEDMVMYQAVMNQVDKWLLCDAVTSGGLLIAVSEADADKMLKSLLEKEVKAKMIGEVTETHKGHITVF